MTPMAFDGGHVPRQDIARLVERHQQALRAFLRRACGDWALADDLAQETFLTAWEKIGELPAWAGMSRKEVPGVKVNLMR